MAAGIVVSYKLGCVDSFSWKKPASLAGEDWDEFYGAILLTDTSHAG